MDQRKDVGTVAFLEENQRFIFYIITKELSYHKPSYDNISAALNELRDLIVEHHIKNLALPRIGCGLDGLDWAIVRGIIENVFQNVECTIMICNFTKVILLKSALITSNSMKKVYLCFYFLQHLSKESDNIFRVEHPTTIKIDKNIKNIENIIL